MWRKRNGKWVRGLNLSVSSGTDYGCMGKKRLRAENGKDFWNNIQTNAADRDPKNRDVLRLARIVY